MRKVLIPALMLCSAVGVVFGDSVELTTDALGLGGTDINYASNGSYVEADVAGKLVMDSAANAGSVLTIQTDGLAGSGTGVNPLLVTVTSRTYLDIQDNLPAGYDFQGGVITLTADAGDYTTEGLGLRAFNIDVEPTSSTYGQRWNDGGGYRMEGSKEVSGGVDSTDWNDFVARADNPPENSPPHVDEDVLFDFNDSEVSVAGDSLSFLLTKVKTGGNALNLGLDITVDLVGGASISQTWGDVSTDGTGGFSLFGGETDVLEVDIGQLFGLADTDIIDSVRIGARDDTIDDEKGTDEHFLINSFEYTVIPEPATLGLIALCSGGLYFKRRFFMD